MTLGIGMMYDQIRPEERMMIDAAKHRNIDLHLYDTDKLVLEISDGRQLKGEQVVFQRSLSYFRSLHLSALLENMGVTVVNSFKAAMICGNKLLTSMVLSKAGIPTPKTAVAFTAESAVAALDKIGYPAMLKPVIGSWGRLIAPLRDPDSARAIFEAREFMFPLYQVYYIQEMIERPPRDLRCFVVDDQPAAAIYRYSPSGEWRTNMARGGKAEECKITPELRELCVRSVEAVGGGAFGVDLMEGPEGLTVHEINYATEFKNTVEITGVDIPGLLLDYAVRKVKR